MLQTKFPKKQQVESYSSEIIKVKHVQADEANTSRGQKTCLPFYITF